MLSWISASSAPPSIDEAAERRWQPAPAAGRSSSAAPAAPERHAAPRDGREAGASLSSRGLASAQRGPSAGR